MKKCKQFHRLIWLSVYDEISDEQQKLLKEHLKDCTECQLDFEEAQQAIKLLNQKVQITPSEKMMKEIRTELHQRLLLMTQPKVKKNWLKAVKQIVTLDLPPALRFSAAVVMLLFGIIIGRFFFTPESMNFQQNFPDLDNTKIANVRSVYYDPASGNISIQLSTFNNLTVEGSPEKPEIQQLLAKTLLLENRPNIRLETVNVLSQTRSFNRQVIEALIQVLEKDENPGIRLKAVKLLSVIPVDSSLRDLITRIFLKVLLKEKNTAIRIQALNGLEKLTEKSFIPALYQAAKKDTNEYIRNKAVHIIERIENPKIFQ